MGFKSIPLHGIAASNKSSSKDNLPAGDD